MMGARNTVLGGDAIGERGRAMGAGFGNQPELAVAGFKENKTFAEHPNLESPAVLHLR
jgi:hypothetical protein